MDFATLRHGWETYFFLIGSSAAALIGIQFIVITLIAGMRRPATAETIAAFATPTVVHLAIALIVSAFVAVPWGTPRPLGHALTLSGGFGLVTARHAFRRARRQSAYKPVGEDWLWHVLVPFALYLALIWVGLDLQDHSEPELYTTAVVALGLVLVGIHNAWDSVTYVVLSEHEKWPPKSGD